MPRNSELQRYRDVEAGVFPISVTATAADLNTVKGKSPLGIVNTGAARTDKTDSYTGVLADANTYIDFGTASGKTFTIPANSSVAYPVGTSIILGKATNALTVAITTDTLVGGNTVAAGSGALLIKTAADVWIGINLTVA